MSFKQFVAAFGTVGKTKISAFWASLAIALTIPTIVAVITAITIITNPLLPTDVILENSSILANSSMLNKSWDALLGYFPVFVRLPFMMLIFLLAGFVLVVNIASLLANWEGIFKRRLSVDSMEYQMSKALNDSTFNKAFYLLFPAAYVVITDYETKEFTNHMLLTLTFSAGVLAIFFWRTLALLQARLKVAAE